MHFVASYKNRSTPQDGSDETGLRNVPTSLFEPDHGKVKEVGVAVADAVVEANRGNCITLILENPNSEPLCLRKGLTLGAIEPIECVLAS